MKLPILCVECRHEFDSSFSNDYAHRSVTIVDIRDDGVYELKCRRGHVTKTVLQQQKFEILFEIGAYAIKDGYYREAVTTFSSSLERLYEFFIYAVMIENKRPDDMIETMWKSISKQSERQLGSFIALYTAKIGCVPTLLNTKNVNFRNNVIHNGVIPDREMAIKYGEEIRKVMYPILRSVKKHCPMGVDTLVRRNVSRGYKKGNPVTTSTMGITTIINLMNNHEKIAKSLEEEIESLHL